MLNLLDAARLTGVAEKTPNFHPGGERGKLHRRLGIPVDQKIPAERLEQAAHSKDPETRREAIRAETMKKWKHKGPKKESSHRTGSEVRAAMYGKG